MKTSSFLLSPENRVLFCTFLLGLFGILTISSSQSHSIQPLHFVLRQSGFLCLGMIFLLSARRVDFQKWQQAACWLFGLFWLLLIYLPFSGLRINGMAGWFKAGSFTFQPSEVGRPFFLLAATLLLVRSEKPLKNFFCSGILAALWLVPVAAQPDFGTAAVYGISFMLLCYLAGISLKWLSLFPLAACALGSYALLTYPYVMRRLTGFLAPDQDPLGSGWHIRQFPLAVARGGWSGSKIGSAVWSNAYLPFSYNDSAGATLLETLGLLGAFLPALLSVILITALLELSLRKNLSRHAKLFISGSGILLAVQILIHMGINLALLPPSGLVLPFISYGGSSLTGLCLMLGIALSASEDKCPETINKNT